MSELMQGSGRQPRWQLLVTVCALALTGPVHMACAAAADGEARPTVWIELGGQLQRVDGRQDPFAPAFTQITPVPGSYTPVSPAEAQRPARYSVGGEAKLVVAPEGSDWQLSASLRYGRSNRDRLVHQQTDIVTNATVDLFGSMFYFQYTDRTFVDVDVKNRASQLILDFKAGKDVGLGLFGRGGQSVFNVGVRFAQIVSSSDVEIHARPYLEFLPYPILGGLAELPLQLKHQDYIGTSINRNSFAGVGPSVSWEASAAVLRDGADASINVDWGLSGAVLFGRQKARGESLVKAYHYDKKYHPDTDYGYLQLYAPKPGSHNRSRSVIVPNIGGFAGLSYNFTQAKISFGYRGEVFFGAIDGGINMRKNRDRFFHGPFAKISIGLGG